MLATGDASGPAIASRLHRLNVRRRDHWTGHGKGNSWRARSIATTLKIELKKPDALQCRLALAPALRAARTALVAASANSKACRPHVTEVCAYDRAGRGWSDSAPVPQDGMAVTTDLHALLERARVPGPFVMVGHSSGAEYVRIFAGRYPEHVAGMVLHTGGRRWDGAAQCSRLQRR